VLSDGKIAEVGCHEELMKKGGIYCELYGAQEWTESSSIALEKQIVAKTDESK
jgi:hypothetical protein